MEIEEYFKMRAEKAEKATYQYSKVPHGNGILYYTSCCGNRMYSAGSDPMRYHGCECPKCSRVHNKTVILYLRSTPEGERVFKNEHAIK